MKFILPVVIIMFGLSLSFASLVQAQEPEREVYKSIVDLPRIDANSQSAEDYVEALFFLSISFAAILAFIKIIFGGVKWMLSDVVTDKQSAKNDIKGAVLGLLIVLSAVIVLDTINPNLTKLNIFGTAPALSPMQQSAQQEDAIPTHLQPSADQNLTRLNCDQNLLGLFGTNCSAAIDQCQAAGGTANASNVVDGKLYCYTPKVAPSGGGCDGYVHPVTRECYGTTIDLGEEFEDQPGNVQEQECLRLGGRSYNYQTGVCRRTIN